MGGVGAVEHREVTWWWVSLDYATFGIEITDGIVTDAAPIARWSRGKSERTVLNYYRRKGATVQPL